MRKWALAAAAAVSLLWAEAAQASTVIATYSGTVTGPVLFSNADGIFGSAATLVGAPVTISFTYDTSLGDVVSAPGANGVQGGPLLGADRLSTSPVTTVDLSVNGQAISFNPTQFGDAVAFDSPANFQIRGQSLDGFFAQIGGPTNPGSSIGSAPVLTGAGIGYVSFFSSDASASRDFWFTLAPLAVPEPASWGLLLLGFFAVGAGLRQKRRLALA